ncbi:MAG: TIGR03032 family protein [Acidimicrobiales bacterium]
MRLATPFTKLLLHVDAAALEAEIAAIDEGSWRPHPEGMAGNTALPLLAAHGDPTDDATRGPMRPTPHLDRLPYTRQVLAGLGTVVGRSRLMRIDQEAEVTPHVDSSHYWWERLRIHVPVVTDPAVVFQVGKATQHLAPGEVWAVDTWDRHRVVNPAQHKRIHLVVDTVGSPAFWELVERSRATPDARAKDIPNRLGSDLTFATETVNQPTVMTPWELNGTLDEIDAMLRATGATGVADELAGLLRPFRRAWRGTWARFGDGPDGWRTFHGLREEASRLLIGHEGRHPLPNGLDVVQAIRSLVLVPALDPDLSATDRPAPRAARQTRRIERPVIVVSSPRSGSSLLFETLARAPELHTIGGESHQLIESIPGLHPSQRGWASNRLTEADATPSTVAGLHRLFEVNARDRNGSRPGGSSRFRLLEKTPKNALRVPFLAEAFPDATFVYLYRDPRETISSMLDAWRSGRFVTYPDLPGWGQPQWSLLLTPGWRDLIDQPLAEVVARQWVETTTMLLDDLEALPADRWCVASYDRLVADPSAEIGQLCEHLGLAWDVDLGEKLPDSRHTLDSPHPDKWKRNAEELDAVWEQVRPVATRAHQVFADPPRIRPVTPVISADQVGGAASAAAPTEAADRRPLRSVHTKSMAALLQELGSSLLVSTYQSGRVIVVRPDGDRVNTHFRTFPSPMGMAQSGDLLALGTKQGVWVYQDQPAVGHKLEPKGRHDACYMPRTHHITGDIRIHDVAFAGSELWIVNTRFSCLATLDGQHSFVPRWRPPFITTLAPEDRCHLNGLTLVDGEVRYASALGITDEAGGWRDHKAAGGVLMEVPSGEVVLSGLSMPHSPRWHDGRLWILESGKGTLSVADLEAGTVETVAHLPGFTRGLAFAGPYAFVGLSQVREHVFGGIPLTDDLDQRVCGVWAVDTRSGEIVGFLRFEGAVQEIYDVQLLAGRRWPEVAEPGAELVSGSFVLSAEALTQT